MLKFKPALILASDSTRASYISLANNVQERTKIPYVLLDGRFEDTPRIYRLLGEILGAKDRAELLAQYADETLNRLRARIAAIPESERPRAYYGRGVNGLEKRPGGLDQPGGAGAGWRCHVAAAAGAGGRIKVSIEQI